MPRFAGHRTIRLYISTTFENEIRNKKGAKNKKESEPIIHQAIYIFIQARNRKQKKKREGNGARKLTINTN